MGAEDEGVDAFVIFGEDGGEFLLFVDVSVDQAAADADDTVGVEKGVERVDGAPARELISHWRIWSFPFEKAASWMALTSSFSAAETSAALIGGSTLSPFSTALSFFSSIVLLHA